ncbi:MAG: alkaline phosphatase family protein [Candidatus Omnitrophica bacterium]|nr:alkaline phosphatase family protein [Candidatus Omnitrophota bacterium]
MLLVSPSLCGAADAARRTLEVPASRQWTDTGVDVRRGEPLHVEAEGLASVVGWRVADWLAGRPVDRWVGPAGTYVWPRHYAARGRFPLPAMAEGPFPAFGLIGKLGEDGEPFAVGERYDGKAPASGRLWLGLNDDELSDNRGAFRVTVELAPHPAAPAPEPPVVEPGSRSGRPIPNARVLLLYVDGLRPDVLREMAEAGFLPAFKRAFLDRGLAVPNAFTVFPSNTLIANGSLFTGLFSDATGIKSQNQFERSSLKPRGQLSAWLPDGFIPKPPTRVLDLLDKYAPEHTHAFLVKRGVPTLGTRLGKAFRFTTLPIAPLNPPPQWFHRAVNTIGPFGIATQLPRRLDTVNAQYAVEEMIGDEDLRVMAVWLPMVDKTCHHSPRGQFGAARRDLALEDRYLARILSRLEEVGWDRSLYLILVSDHGNMGGERTVNQACNLPRDWAHRQLGWSAKVVGQEWMQPGIEEDRFAFFDNQGAGQVKLFLPYGSYFAGPWRRNRLAELARYRAAPGRTVNLLESLAAFRPPGWNGQGPAPVDLILVKLDERRVFVYRDEQDQAIIHHETDRSGGEVYRYEPVRQLSQADDGTLAHEPARPAQDPLGYLRDPAFLRHASPGWLAEPHTAREWLAATAETRYPDAVVAMAKFFAWRDSMQDLAEVRDPDLVATASEGWSFRSDDGAGTDHGYPLAGSMRMTCVLAGPNIPHGTLTTPHRIVDILPTMLEMVGWPYDPKTLDGEAIQGIYE